MAIEKSQGKSKQTRANLAPNGTAERILKDLSISDLFWEPFANSHEAVLLYDPGSEHFVLINEAAGKLLGFSTQVTLPIQVAQIQSEKETAFQAFAGNVQTHGLAETDQLFFKQPDGEILQVVLSGVALSIGGHPLVLAFARKNIVKPGTERLLWESEQRFGALIENMQEGVMIVDNDDVIQFGNRRIYRMLDYDFGELTGKTGYRLLFRKSDQKLIREKNQLRTQKVADQYEVQMLKKSGDKYMGTNQRRSHHQRKRCGQWFFWYHHRYHGTETS